MAVEVDVCLVGNGLSHAVERVVTAELVLAFEERVDTLTLKNFDFVSAEQAVPMENAEARATARIVFCIKPPSRGEPS